jgi:hypothetical protein
MKVGYCLNLIHFYMYIVVNESWILSEFNSFLHMNQNVTNVGGILSLDL